MVYVKHSADCREIVAADRTRLKELLHPHRDNIACRYSLARATLGPGCESLPHSLEQTEVYYIVRGCGTMHVGGEECPVGPGDTVYVPAGSEQWLQNTGAEEMEFLCIVDPAWQKDKERVRSSA